MKKILLSLATVPLLSTSCFDNRLSDLDWIETTTETGFEYDVFSVESYDPDNEGIDNTTDLLFSGAPGKQVVNIMKNDSITVEKEYPSSGKLVSTFINDNSLKIIDENRVETNIDIKNDNLIYLFQKITTLFMI